MSATNMKSLRVPVGLENGLSTKWLFAERLKSFQTELDLLGEFFPPALLYKDDSFHCLC
jgi:hypothetical protein